MITKKNGTFKNIPTRRIKDISDLCSPVLANIWNEEILLNKNFPENLKLADVTPIFKKKDKTFVENYRPVSVLPTVSKIFELIMQKQITDYIGKFLSPFLCGYRKGFSTQYALLSLIERWRLCLDKHYYHKALRLGCCSSPRSASEYNVHAMDSVISRSSTRIGSWSHTV